MAKGRGRGPLPCKVLDLVDVAGLRALRTVNDLELDRLAFLERTEAVALDRRVVDEHVTASVAFDESVTLGVVEPLDLTCDTHRSSSCLLGRHVSPAGGPSSSFVAASLNRLRQPLPKQKKRPHPVRPFPFGARPARRHLR